MRIPVKDYYSPQSTIHLALVMGPGQNFLTRVGSAIYGLG